MAVPTKEEVNVSEQEKIAAEEYSELSSVQFSAQYTAEQEPPQEPEPAAPEQQLTEQAQQEQEEMTRRDREILAALDEVLQKNSAQRKEPVRTKRFPADVGKLAVGVVGKGAGVLSLALTLVFMGIVLVCVTISAEPDYLLIAKLSPIAAVLLGAELLLNWFASGKQLKVNIPCVCIIAAIVTGCCAMSAALNKSETTEKSVFSSRIVEAEIYEASYKQLRHSADILELTVKADLIPDSEKKSMDTLTAGDKVLISAVLDGNYMNPREFAAECRRIIEVYEDLDIPVMSYHFSSETRLSSFSLDVEGLFQQNMTEEELTSLVRHIYVEDYDYIADLEDISEETSETAENAETAETIE